MARHFFYILLLLAFFLQDCQSKKTGYVSRPTRSTGIPGSEPLEINAVAYHQNDSITMVYLQINNENLLYKRPDTSKAFYADAGVSYKLLSDMNSDKVLDSASFNLLDRAGSEQVKIKYLYAGFRMKAHRPNNFYLSIDVFDHNRRNRYNKGLNVYKKNNYTSQNFLITLHDSVAFKNNFLVKDEVEIQCASQSVSKVMVDCYFREFGPALPPFSTKAADEFKYKPDSAFLMRMSSSAFMLTMPEKGFYHLRPDENSAEGVTLYTVDKTFPGVSNSLEMINCTRYIMFREEYEACRDAVDKKAAIDEFWLNVGGSLERARELLRRYYSRVKEANKNYSNYTQGWKSDRGMIFIVMGPPANVYKSTKEEIWMYGNEANPNALRFVFRKTENPFSDNDFILERTPFYKESYHTAVEYWRQGLVYSESK